MIMALQEEMLMISMLMSKLISINFKNLIGFFYHFIEGIVCIDAGLSTSLTTMVRYLRDC
jgi:hypothetical protein